MLGEFTIKDPTDTADPIASRPTYFSIRGGLELSINENGFQFFAVAKIEIQDSPLVKAALFAVAPPLALLQEASILGVISMTTGGGGIGLAGQLDITFSIGAGDSQLGLGGVSPSVSLTGEFKLLFNTTEQQFTYDIPQEFVSLLDPHDPTEIVLPAAPTQSLDSDPNVLDVAALGLPTTLDVPAPVAAALVSFFAANITG